MIDKHKKLKCINPKAKSGMTLKSKQLCHVVSALLLTYYHDRAMFKSAFTAWSGMTRSLLPKITELKYITANTKAAILSVTETWLDESVSDAEIQILGYNILRRDRNRHGGGVCVYIRSDIAFNERWDLQNKIIETLWIDLLLPKTKPILISTCYRPPNQTHFLECFENILASIRSDVELYILGDFNICFKGEKICFI